MITNEVSASTFFRDRKRVGPQHLHCLADRYKAPLGVQDCTIKPNKTRTNTVCVVCKCSRELEKKNSWPTVGSNPLTPSVRYATGSRSPIQKMQWIYVQIIRNFTLTIFENKLWRKSCVNIAGRQLRKKWSPGTYFQNFQLQGSSGATEGWKYCEK